MATLATRGAGECAGGTRSAGTTVCNNKVAVVNILVFVAKVFVSVGGYVCVRACVRVCVCTYVCSVLVS